MFNSGIILKTNVDFENAKFFQTEIEIMQNGEIINAGGVIEEISNISIKVNGGYFLKINCHFRVK